MPWKKDVGLIHRSSLRGERFLWVINDFFALPQNSESRLISPEFTFDSHTCCLGLWPCMDDVLGYGEWIGLNLWIHPSRYPLTLNFFVKLGIQSFDGTEFRCCSVECEDEYCEKKLFSFEQPNILSRTQFLRQVDKIAPFGSLMVFCEIRTNEDTKVETASLPRRHTVFAA